MHNDPFHRHSFSIQRSRYISGSSTGIDLLESGEKHDGLIHVIKSLINKT